MKHLTLTALLVAMAVPAYAQAPAANPDPSKPAVTINRQNTATTPAAGANSFTEAQAKSRIEAAGYTNVMGLAKDTNGVWRGKGSKGGASVDVGLDYQGNIVPK